jgi:PhoH-like ATPase
MGCHIWLSLKWGDHPLHINPSDLTGKFMDKMSKERKLFVIDTNILMHDPTAIYRFEEHDIYLPMVVLEELDNHKTGLSEVARNVRQTNRMLVDLMSNGRITHH